MKMTFSEALTRVLDETGISLRAVAEGAGVSYEQLKKVKQGKSKSTNVDDAVKVANFLGMTLDELLDDDTAAIRSEIVDLYNQLTQQQRSFLLASVKGILSGPAIDN